MFSNLIKGIRGWRELGLFEKVHWPRARMIFADVPLDYDIAKEWVPFPLTLSRSDPATIFFAHYPQTVWGAPYYEAAILLNTKLFGIFPVLHNVWMIVDDDQHLIQGRELGGCPKKMGVFRFEEKDGKFFGNMVRRGAEVFRVEGTIGNVLSKPIPGSSRRWWVNARHWMSFLPGHLLLFKVNEKVHQANAMDLKVTITPSQFDPLSPVTGPVTNASIRTCDMWMPKFPLPLRIWPVGPGFIGKMIRLRNY